MGGIKDQLSFCYTEDDYQLLMFFITLFKIYGLIPRRSAAVKAVEKKKKKL
jgi:hypothetical protein